VIAFVDESIRRPIGLYVIGCVIAPCGEYAALRETFGGPRFHFSRESEERQVAFLGRICDQGLGTAAYVSRGLHDERARGLCMKALLWDLKQTWEACELVIESRQDHNDLKDARVIGGAKRSGIADASLKYGWERPADNPLLWTADAVAGAVASNAYAGGGFEDFLVDRCTPIKSVSPRPRKRASPGFRRPSVARAPLPRP